MTRLEEIPQATSWLNPPARLFLTKPHVNTWKPELNKSLGGLGQRKKKMLAHVHKRLSPFINWFDVM